MEIVFELQRESEAEFIARVNAWLVANQDISIDRMDADSSGRLGLLVNNSVFDTIKFTYKKDASYSNAYGVCVDEILALHKIGLKDMKAKWIEKNPHLKYIASSYVHNARGSAGSLVLGGFMARNRNKLCVLYKAMAQPVQAAAPAQNKFCTGCGAKLEENAKFCTSCGKKL